MGAHGSQITPDYRWKMVTYIRELQAESGGISGAEKGANR
jgi:hypothetical protein